MDKTRFASETRRFPTFYHPDCVFGLFCSLCQLQLLLIKEHEHLAFINLEPFLFFFQRQKYFAVEKVNRKAHSSTMHNVLIFVEILEQCL